MHCHFKTKKQPPPAFSQDCIPEWNFSNLINIFKTQSPECNTKHDIIPLPKNESSHGERRAPFCSNVILDGTSGNKVTRSSWRETGEIGNQRRIGSNHKGEFTFTGKS